MARLFCYGVKPYCEGRSSRKGNRRVIPRRYEQSGGLPLFYETHRPADSFGPCPRDSRSDTSWAANRGWSGASRPAGGCLFLNPGRHRDLLNGWRHQPWGCRIEPDHRCGHHRVEHRTGAWDHLRPLFPSGRTPTTRPRQPYRSVSIGRSSHPRFLVPRNLDDRHLHAAFDDPRADGIAGEACRVVDVELVHETIPVLLNGLDANAKRHCYLFIGFAFGN